MHLKRLVPALAGALALAAAVIVPALHSDVASAQRPPSEVENETVQLFPGCNLVGMTVPNGTNASAVASAIQPTAALDVIWRYNADTRRFVGFRPNVPAFASDFTTVSQWDAVYVCVNARSTLQRPVFRAPVAGSQVMMPLATGCNLATIVAPTGTSSADIAKMIAPDGSLDQMWQVNNETKRFAGYMPNVPAFANDFSSITRYDAIVICMKAGGTLTQTLPS